MSCRVASMDVHTAQVQAAVQQLVMEHGEYAPLELLLATNRLGYEDYRAWREGRLGTLDAVLADGKRVLPAWLEGAQSWAHALGLAAESAVHHGWENNAGTVLIASADPRLNALLRTRFRRAQEHDQLDLFIDSAQTAAVNALGHALTARHASEARGALERLVRINSDRARAIESWFALCHLAPEAFEQLIEASDFPVWSLQNAWRVAQEQALEHEMTPAWFPAWMLPEEPGLASVLAPRHTDDEPSRAFDVVIALLVNPDLDERGIELRRSLQAIHPGLLDRFLATRARVTAPVPLSG